MPLHEDIIQDLIKVKKEVEKSPTREDYKEKGEFSINKIEQIFGGWNNAKSEAGLECYHERQNKKRIPQEKKLVDVFELIVENSGTTLREIRKKIGYNIELITYVRELSAMEMINYTATKDRIEKLFPTFKGMKYYFEENGGNGFG